MRVTPDELRDLARAYEELYKQRRARTDPALLAHMVAVASAIVRICDTIEPNMVWAKGDDSIRPTQWLFKLEMIRAWTKQALTPPVAGMNWPEPPNPQDLLDLHKLAEATWRGPSSGIRPFPFMKNPVLRQIAERDYASLIAALKGSEAKMGLVLAGSVVEAILVDLLELDPQATKQAYLSHPKSSQWNKKVDPTKPAEWIYFVHIAVAGDDGLKALSKKTEKIAQELRDWRNYVHPCRERDAQQSDRIRPSDATLAGALVDKILDEVNEWHEKRQSLTP